jgi:TolB protein
VTAGGVTEIDLTLTPVWNARAAGWLAGEHHFHLNYGGPYRLSPEELLPVARAEDMDVLTPLLANLHTRFEDQPLWNWHRLSEPPYIAFGQEVRSHFLGHLGLVGTAELHWPWIWGPGYDVYGRDDRPNSDVLAFSRRQGGIST